MFTRDIIVIGGSAGSLKPLQQVLSQLPNDLHVAVFVTIHRGKVEGPDYLPDIITRSSNLSTTLAQTGERFVGDHIYVAPRRVEMVIEGGVLSLRADAPAIPRKTIDELFTFAVHAYGERVIGILLSGTLYDGTARCWEIRKHGGVTIAQDPSEATYPSMPQSAMNAVPVDYCLRSSEMSARLEELVRGHTTARPTQSARDDR